MEKEPVIVPPSPAIGIAQSRMPVLPPFVEPVLDIVAEPPFRHEDTTLHALLIKGNLDALQTSIDSMFAPLGHDLRVETPVVLATALYVDRAFGETGSYARFGWSRETDVALWALVKSALGRRFWVPLYMFVDSGIALVAGREIYGFPKQMCMIERDMTTLATDLSVNVRTEHFPPADERIAAVTETLLAIEPVSGNRTSTGFNLSAAEFALRFAELSGLGRRIADVVAPYGSPNDISVPMLFLKQFRDIAQPSRAAYRAAVWVSTKSVGKVGMQIASGEWLVRVAPSASHPTTRDLGVKAENPALAAFIIRQDFVVGTGGMLMP